MKDQIFDRTRRKEIVLTPEEKVRQAVITWLHEKKNVPYSHIRSEYPVRIGGRCFRADILVTGRNLNPLVMVECKAAGISIDRKAVEQIATYNTLVKARYLILTNGVSSYILEKEADGTYRQITDIPDYRESDSTK